MQYFCRLLDDYDPTSNFSDAAYRLIPILQVYYKWIFNKSLNKATLLNDLQVIFTEQFPKFISKPFALSAFCELLCEESMKRTFQLDSHEQTSVDAFLSSIIGVAQKLMDEDYNNQDAYEIQQVIFHIHEQTENEDILKGLVKLELSCFHPESHFDIYDIADTIYKKASLSNTLDLPPLEKPDINKLYHYGIQHFEKAMNKGIAGLVLYRFFVSLTYASKRQHEIEASVKKDLSLHPSLNNINNVLGVSSLATSMKYMGLLSTHEDEIITYIIPFISLPEQRFAILFSIIANKYELTQENTSSSNTFLSKLTKRLAEQEENPKVKKKLIELI